MHSKDHPGTFISSSCPYPSTFCPLELILTFLDPPLPPSLIGPERGPRVFRRRPGRTARAGHHALHVDPEQRLLQPVTKDDHNRRPGKTETQSTGHNNRVGGWVPGYRNRGVFAGGVLGRGGGGGRSRAGLGDHSREVCEVMQKGLILNPKTLNRKVFTLTACELTRFATGRGECSSDTPDNVRLRKAPIL